MQDCNVPDTLKNEVAAYEWAAETTFAGLRVRLVTAPTNGLLLTPTSWQGPSPWPRLFLGPLDSDFLPTLRQLALLLPAGPDRGRGRAELTGEPPLYIRFEPFTDTGPARALWTELTSRA